MFHALYYVPDTFPRQAILLIQFRMHHINCIYLCLPALHHWLPPLEDSLRRALSALLTSRILATAFLVMVE
jgi:hypothetical protein